MARSSAWEGLDYRPLGAPWEDALALFKFAGAWAPPLAALASGWGAWADARLCAALLLERTQSAAMLWGPVVVAPAEADPEAALDAADRLVAEALGPLSAAGVDTAFARPQGLDRVWVREGFIPVPEAELPPELRGRPGLGLYGWRGGSALWSQAGRGVARAQRAER